ncbi:fasciclin domain-containing protein [Aliiroseovarius sp.]|uniref:fasciclin domain-containing protein n=1 Tax=Aliiroseovarius sp. TaxID=1872442 RepID=UPI002624D4FB|nr:fasciclin domain-containing protein [Aliiroseovarius sp.]
MMKRTLTALSLALALATPAAASEADIVDTAVAAGNFTTLATALGAAGLVDTLKGDGPFTVYAPTDAAFAALPAGTVETLLKPENKDQLIAILTYHVSPGKLVAKQVAHKDMVGTVNGEMVDVTLNGDGTVNLDDAFIITANIETSNGIIHVIDRVMIPDSK